MLWAQRTRTPQTRRSYCARVILWSVTAKNRGLFSLDQRRFDVLFSRLCAIAANVEMLTLGNATMVGMWFGPRGFFILPTEANAAYGHFITGFLREDDWELKFSFQYVNPRLLEVLEDYKLLGVTAARNRLEELTHHLEAFNQTQIVFLPLLGLTLDDQLQRVFGGITLHRATDEFLRSITKPETTEYVKRQTGTFVWAEVTVLAEPHRAASRAEEACQPLIDVLRFWMACMAPAGTPCAIGLQGDIVTAERPRIINTPDVKPHVRSSPFTPNTGTPAHRPHDNGTPKSPSGLPR
jgi:hypothetical protein